MRRAVVLGLAFVAAFTGSSVVAHAEVREAAETEALMAGISQSGRTLGNSRAPLTLTYFHDLKCPFCHAFSLDVLPTIIRRYVRAGKLKITANPVAFVGLDGGTDSRRAAAAAAAVGNQRKYWNFMDLFYRNQQDESTTYVGDAYLSELAGAIPGADVQLMLSQKSSTSISNSLKRSRALFDRLELSGVPSVFLTRTGRRLRQSDELEQRTVRHISRAIRNELKRIERRR